MSHSDRRVEQIPNPDAPITHARFGVLGRPACVVIACAAAIPLLLSIRSDLRTTNAVLSPASTELAARTLRQEMCIYRAIRNQLPDGAKVYIADANVGHDQRLAELATTWAVPEANPAHAQWKLAIAHGACFRVRLKAGRI